MSNFVNADVCSVNLEERPAKIVKPDITVLTKQEFDAWKLTRADGGARLGIEKDSFVSYTPLTMPDKNLGLPTTVKNDHLHCPCTICKHIYQPDCERMNCICCSSLCT